MTNPEYILEFMRENDMRFYTLSNSFDRETVKQFNEQMQNQFKGTFE